MALNKLQKLTQNSLLKWKIPSMALPTELNKLTELSKEVNQIDTEYIQMSKTLATNKSRLDSIKDEDFSILSRGLDLYAGLRTTLKTKYNMQVATNATMKMYELIVHMQLIACDDGAQSKAKIFCNAELPGGFIVAINHYIKTQCPDTNFDWLASSYFPLDAINENDKTILDDKYGFYTANRDQWLMGPSPNALSTLSAYTQDRELLSKMEGVYLTGNIKDKRVVSLLADAAHARFCSSGGATLYTGDVGADVSMNYNKQEETTSLLNYGQVVCGLLSIAKGGNMVTKQYTYFTPFSRSLIALISSLFEETYIVKPLTSRPSNSEIYIVAKKFKGIDDKLSNLLLERLSEYLEFERKGITPGDLSPLINSHKDVEHVLTIAARQLFIRQQVPFLIEMVTYYNMYNRNLYRIEKILSIKAAELQKKWIAENSISRIRDDQHLAH